MFDCWCEINKNQHNDKKTFFALNEKGVGRAMVENKIIQKTRSHYDDLENITSDIKRLGFPKAAAILGERLPRTLRAQSGEMGEILATEFIEFQTEFYVPVRRLRYKDGREMALRGDDFIGLGKNENKKLLFLKGEAKSGQSIANAVIVKARKKLSADDGRPTAISLLFIADRLVEGDEDNKELGCKIRDEVANKTMPSQRITHGFFTLSGNTLQNNLMDDLDAADKIHPHISINLHIQNHQAFIADIYEKARDLGNN